ncbi:ANTAR domain-containing protein [Jatrophihabitans telluris]|uniref:ANTAR domain-containing protein n=1 Tax=Jatrophihabitans telluris TaxID=2038343 RepID=A0ABY4R1V0_9ACTN|nr:ANTAR domain-containing protein [Jatrophihabitans telluris]UQX89292.1 ANTAR domain-containing protein [Jatrophihabitans telluris]
MLRAPGYAHLVASVEPAVVFSSLASACVPELADECHVTLVEDDGVAYRISMPATANCLDTAIEDVGDVPPPWAAQHTGPGTLRTPIASPRADGERRYRGSVVHRWLDGHPPTAAQMHAALLLVDLAVVLVARERLSEQLRHRAETTENLRQAVLTSREIGAALGILMVTHKATQDEAFALLRSYSQHTHRKLRDVAADVVLSGSLPAQVRLRGPLSAGPGPRDGR